VAATGATELLLHFCDRLSPLLPYFEFLPRPATLPIPAGTATIHFTALPYPALPRHRVPTLYPRASTGINSETPEKTTCRGSVGQTEFRLGCVLPNVTSSPSRVKCHCGKNMLRPAGRCLPRRGTIARVKIAPLPFR